MRAALPLLVAGLVAGCDAPPPAGNEAAPAAEAASATATVARPAATGSGLSAEVSALGADLSGLNVRVTDTATIIDLPTDTLFAFDSADLSAEAEPNLAKVANAIRSGGAGPIGIVGHTDAKGEDAYNQALSERRAEAVAAWMRGQVGVRQRAFSVSGKGETAPVAPNAQPDGGDDPAGRAKNRRVEVVIPR